jgi:hypothetical protein
VNGSNRFEFTEGFHERSITEEARFRRTLLEACCAYLDDNEMACYGTRNL